MKRLTERVEGEALPLEGVTEVDLVIQLCDYEDTGLSPHAARMANLYLADYEATGMTPVQILNLKDEKKALDAGWAKLEQARAFTDKLRRNYNERLAEDKRVYRDEVRRLNRTLQENHEKLIAAYEKNRALREKLDDAHDKLRALRTTIALKEAENNDSERNGD